jgi:serine/threonine-protein kinase
MKDDDVRSLASGATPGSQPSAGASLREVPSDSLVGRRLSQRYEILGLIGLGGAGHVYEAVQHPLGRRVAIKVMRTDIASSARQQFAQRFLREAALAGRLHHPNIVTVHDFGDDDGLLYVVMELLQGRTLQKALKHGPLPAEEVARIGIGLSRGLRHAHEQGLVHRDVKPLNIMLVTDDEGREQPKLMDFGLVKSLRTEDDSMTLVGQFMGTPAFMAPEQARGQEIDGRADLYALGVVLYRMLSGQLPFEADHPLGYAVLHQSEPIPPMATLAPDVKVSAELEQIVRRAMAKKPDDRFPDAAAMAEALERWLSLRLQPSPTVPPAHELPQAPARKAGLLVVVGTVAMAVAGVSLLGVGVVGLALGFLTARSGPAPGPAPVEVVAAVLAPAVAPAPVPEVVPAEVVPVEVAPAPVAPTPVAQAPAAPRPAPAAPPPKPSPAAPAPSGEVVVDEVAMTAAQGKALLALVNGATPAELESWGVYDQGVGVILKGRPFSTLQQFGDTKGIGKKTIEVLLARVK